MGAAQMGMADPCREDAVLIPGLALPCSKSQALCATPVPCSELAVAGTTQEERAGGLRAGWVSRKKCNA